MALEQLCAVLKVLLITVLVVEGIAVAQKTQDGQNIGIKHIPATQCGIWVRTSNGGHFASPNYPDSYPPNKECIYILEAAPRQRIELTFDERYYIEPSFECRFDHLEIRDGPFGFSPLIDRYCGMKSPALIRSTGRFMWIKFSSDEELEGLGFRAKYSFIPDPDFTYLGGILNPIPDCQFELSGADGIVRSSQVEQEEKTKPGQAVDCIWTIKATPKAKIYLRFLDYQMEHSNECKRNFVAVYDGSSAIENLKAKLSSFSFLPQSSLSSEKLFQRSIHREPGSYAGRRTMQSISNEQKACKVLGIVFFLFVVMWCPFFITNIMAVICKESCNENVIGALLNVFVWIGYLSSAVNPLVYTLFNKTYRSAFSRYIQCQYKENRKPLQLILVNTIPTLAYKSSQLQVGQKKELTGRC